MQEKALVVLSGGQDSTTCLYWATKKFGVDAVETVTFDYGQRHRVELECAAAVARHAGVEHRCLPIDTFTALGGDALTDAGIDVATASNEPAGLPNTFVPGRNLVFLTYAAALAWQLGIDNLVTGVAQTDYSGYPDCRDETLRAVRDHVFNDVIWPDFTRLPSPERPMLRFRSCLPGDTVTIQECRPISKSKSWRLVKVVERPAG